ncbi:MAG: class I SAM-dependent methyltransferase [Solirubrobacteraceae bacterium]
MTSALRMYGDGLSAVGHSRVVHRARLRDGTDLPLALERWLGPADAIDEQLLDGLRGPVLDVGCGPGRHLRALSERGVLALGVDLSPVAVDLAVGRGTRAIVGDIFDDLPGGAIWRSALLLDGNIGIGGSPERLLARLTALLVDSGEVLVEIDSPDGSTCSTLARIETDGTVSPWFPWARVAVPDIARIARAGGFAVSAVWPLGTRWFARLRRGSPSPGSRPVSRSGHRPAVGSRRPAPTGPVP